MYLILGLGNPGKEYKDTRHNVGFWAVEKIAEQFSIDLTREKHRAIYGEGYIGGQKVILAKPLTYMNNSGESARGFCDFYKIEPQNVIVLYDDMNLSAGSIRIREKGSDGGHNGIKSIIYHLISNEFPRVRFGVGAPKGKGEAVVRHVLGRMSGEDGAVVEESVRQAGDIVETIIRTDVKSAMNKFNKTVKTEEQ